MTTVHTEGDTVVINNIVRIKCRDEENATLFAASFECDVYHHTETVISYDRNYQLVNALKECVQYIEENIEQHIVGLSSEPNMRNWVTQLRTLIGD